MTCFDIADLTPNQETLLSTILFPPGLNQVCFWIRENRSCSILTQSLQVATAKRWDGCR